MRRILFLWYIFILLMVGTPSWLRAQNCGIEDTIAIPVNRPVPYDFQISDVVNNDLADPAQGICGIELDFDHRFSENLEISLISPSGQRIQLMGPNSPDQLAFTFGAKWKINFVPCAETAQPDSGYVAKWSNSQSRNFVSGGRYKGSYYPFSGCLEDFDTGSVNGTWRISINNNPSIYPGNITHFRLRFCDERGFICCNADAGSLAAVPDVQGCQGDSSLDLTLQPDYGATAKPDSTEYGYTYVISQNGLIIGYDSLANLRTFQPGNYTVCGLSYRRADRDSLPLANANYPLDTLRRQLNGNLLLYCGKITTNCIEVTIGTPPPTAFVSDTICQGESYRIGNQSLTIAGAYNVTLKSAGGCDSLVRLTLTVVNPSITNLNLAICPGDSVVVGISIYKTAGTYTDTLSNVNGCDSIINLTLAIQPIIQTAITVSICEGGRYLIGNDTLTVPATYRITLPSAQGCDSIVNVTLTISRPVAIITPPDTISCANPNVTLTGSTSTPAGQLIYTWTDTTGMQLNTTSDLTVNAPGKYILTVSQLSNGTTCTASDTVQVVGSSQPPIADAGDTIPINCINSTVQLGGANTSVGANFRYLWRALNGNILGDSTRTTARADATGDYILIVTNTLNGCIASDTVTVMPDFNPPTAEAGAPDTLTCGQTSVTLDATGSSTGANFFYAWINATGDTIGTMLTQNVDEAGTYIFRVLNVINGCVATDSVKISTETGMPMVTLADSILIPCTVDTFTIRAIVNPPNGNYRLSWNGPVIIGAANRDSIQINQAGTYIFSVTNLQNNCAVNDTVIVTKQDCDICIQLDVPDTLTCQVPILTLTAAFCEICDNCTLNWTTTNGNILSGANTLTPTVNAGGRYTLTVTNTSGFSDTFNLEVFQSAAIPTLIILQPDTINCTQSSVTLDGSGSATDTNIRYAWRNAAGNIIGTNTTQVVTIAGNYIFEVTNIQSGCTARDTVQVSGDTLRPIANAGIDTSLSCTRTSVVLSGNGSSTGANFSYNWTTSGGNIVSGATTLTPTVNAPGLYILTVTNVLNNCVATDSVRVLPSGDLPTVPTFRDTFLTCNNPILTLTGAVPSGNFQARWCELDANNNPINCTNNPTLTISSAGTYLFEITDLNTGCRNSTTAQVLDQRNSLVADAGTGDTLGCNQTSIQLSGSVTPDSANYRYKWTALNGSPITNDSTLAPTVTQPDIYILQITNLDNGCVANDSVEVLQNAQTPTAFAGYDSTLNCVTTSLQLQGTAVGGNLRFEWTTQNGNIVSGANTLTPTVNQPGIYFLLVTNPSNNCTAQDTVEIRQRAQPPTAIISNINGLTCINMTATLDGSTSTSQTGTALTYTWSALNGGNLTGNLTSPSIQTQTPGTYQLIVTDPSNSCRDITIADVRSDLKNPEIPLPTPLPLTCLRKEITLPATTNVANVDLKWIDSTGRVLGVANAVVTITQPGVYRLLVTGRTNGCVDTTRTMVTIDTLSPNITIAPTGNLSCNNNSAPLIASVAGGGTFTYNWTTSDGKILSGATSSTATAGSGGTYLVQVTDVNRGCVGQASVAVDETEAAIRQAFFTITPPNCIRQGSGFVQIDSVSGGTAPYQYGLGELPLADDDYFQNIRAGAYILRLQDTNGCEWDTTLIVPQPTGISVELGEDLLINFGDTVQIKALTDSTRFQSIFWTVNTIPFDSINTQLTVSPPLTTEYAVTVTANNGCTATDILIVAVTQTIDVFIPNVFTPNDDGANDVFMVYGGDNVMEVKTFMIFDRWGNHIFQAGPFQPNDPTFGWDGSFNGQAMDAGVYIFAAQVLLKDGRTEMIKGDVTLLR